MGTDTNFIMRHNLNVSSIEVLTSELHNKLGCSVRGFISSYDIEILQDLGLPYNKHYKEKSGADIYVVDDYQVARSLVAAYGEQAKAVIANHSKYEYLTDQIDDVNQGLYYYYINYKDLKVLDLITINNNTLSGYVRFAIDRWSYFTFALDKVKENNTCLTDLIDDRKHIYEFLKPLLIDGYIYYHADQGEQQELRFVDCFDDIPKLLLKKNLSIFELSDFILNNKCTQVYNSKDVEYIIRDDFQDLD